MTTINITRATIRERRAVTDQCTPVLTRGSRSDTSQLLPITIAGRTRYRPPCTLDDCTNPIRVLSAQLCRSHYYRQKRWGDPHIAPPRGRPNPPKGPDHPSYKPVVGYSAAHYRIRSLKSSADARQGYGTGVAAGMPAAHGQAGLPSAPTPRLPTASDDPQHHKPRTPPGGQGCRPLHRPAWPCADPPTPSRPSQAHSGALVTHAPLPHAQPPQRTHRTAPQTPPDRTTPPGTYPPGTALPCYPHPTRYLAHEVIPDAHGQQHHRLTQAQQSIRRNSAANSGHTIETPREHNAPTEQRQRDSDEQRTNQNQTQRASAAINRASAHVHRCTCAAMPKAHTGHSEASSK